MSLKTLTMSYLQWDDTPASGEVEFELVVTTQSALSIYPRWIEIVTLGATPADPGEGSLSIRANDSVGFNPSDSYYMVRERIDGVVRQAQYKIQILEAMASPIHLSDLREAALDPVALTPGGTPLTEFYAHTGRIASDTVLGHIRIGSGLTIDPDTGILSAGGGTTSDTDLIDWAAAEAWAWANVVYDLTYPLQIASATLTWPDGSSGVFTAVTIDAVWQEITDWTASHADSGKTVTYGTLTRNSAGQIISPAATYSVT